MGGQIVTILVVLARVPIDIIIAPLVLGYLLTPEVGLNPEELIRQIKAFQHVRDTGEVTPSGWKPGEVTLKPGPDLVGKVWKAWKP